MFVERIKRLNFKFFNRIYKIIKNEDILGTAGNHFLRMKQYCQGTDVVVTLHGNSSLIGRQAFNIINAVFQDEDTWLAFFSPLRMQDGFYKATDPIDVKANFRK